MKALTIRGNEILTVLIDWRNTFRKWVKRENFSSMMTHVADFRCDSSTCWRFSLLSLDPSETLSFFWCKVALLSCFSNSCDTSFRTQKFASLYKLYLKKLLQHHSIFVAWNPILSMRLPLIHLLPSCQEALITYFQWSAPFPLLYCSTKGRDQKAKGRGDRKLSRGMSIIDLLSTVMDFTITGIRASLNMPLFTDQISPISSYLQVTSKVIPCSLMKTGEPLGVKI